MVRWNKLSTNKKRSAYPAKEKTDRLIGENVPAIVPAQRHFVDTLSIRTVQSLPKPAQNRLRRTGSHATHFDGTPNPFDREYAYRTQLTAPTDDQLRILHTATKRHSKPPKINRLDLKLEILTDQPDQLGERIERFLIKPNHRNCYVRQYKNTRYTGHRNSASQIVTYSDKGSKLDGQTCVQVEWRFVGRRAVERIGVKTIEDVISFNHQQFWQKRLTLKRIERIDLGKAWLRKFKLKGNPSYVGWVIERAAMRLSEVSSQDVADWLSETRINTRYAFKSVSLNELIRIELGVRGV